MIEAKQTFIKVNSEAEDDETLIIIIINPAAKRHFELQINTLQNAPRNAAKLEQIIKAKERENDRARHIDDTLRLVTEIEMLKFVLYLVNRNRNTTQRQDKRRQEEEEEVLRLDFQSSFMWWLWLLLLWWFCGKKG